MEEHALAVSAEVNAAKETISGDDVLSLLQEVKKVYVANGRKIVEFDPGSADREELLQKVTGRTGNLRAPALRIGQSYYIGFNEDLYDKIASLK